MFNVELARITDIYLTNKRHTETLVRSQKASIDLLIKQELQVDGIESEFFLKRVPRIPFG